jgi:hypothetical protein
VAAGLIVAASGVWAVPAAAAPITADAARTVPADSAAVGGAAVTGAACLPGQGVTVVVDFAPVREQVDMRCAPDAAGSVRDAYEAAGFGFGASGAFITEIDGVDASTLGDQGWWGLFTSTADGYPGGPAATDWQMAMVGGDGGPVETDEAYFFRLFDSWSCTDPVACGPQLPLADVLARQGTGSVAPPARTTPGVGSATQAAAWIGGQLAASGGVLALNGSTDWGLTIDALFALAATGVGADQGAATAAKLYASGEAYVGAPGDIASKWPAVAKLTLALQVAGLDPAALPSGGVGGGARNLVADLRGVLGADGSFGSGDTAFSHAIALIALSRTDGGVPPAALSWLRSQQCADQTDPAFGSFGWSPGCGSPDPDATALAIQGLVAGGLAASDQSVSSAAGWLAAKQEADGGFPSSFGGANANTTGLAAGTLALVGGYDTVESAAAGYVGGLQITCATLTVPGSVLTEPAVGAIAFDQTGLDEAVELGLDEVNTDQFRRATAQAVFALGAPGLAALTFDGAAAALPSVTCAQPTSGSSGSSAITPTGSGSPTSAALPITGTAVSIGLSAMAVLAVAVGAILVAHRRRAIVRVSGSAS